MAAAGIANNVGDAGAMLKPLAAAFAVAPFSVDLVPVLASFCCAQIGRASRAPIAKVAHHLRIVSSINETKSLIRFLASTPLLKSTPALDGDAGWHAAEDMLPKLRGGFTLGLLRLETDGGMKQVAAGESIFHKFIILQALRIVERGAGRTSGSPNVRCSILNALH